jgi:hypothetical protein
MVSFQFRLSLARQLPNGSTELAEVLFGHPFFRTKSLLMKSTRSSVNSIVLSR